MFPEENVWDARPGPSRSVTKGLFYMFRPLQRGTHTLRARGHHDVFGDVELLYRVIVGNPRPASASLGEGNASAWWSKTKRVSN
jgi:hypothetical protein